MASSGQPTDKKVEQTGGSADTDSARNKVSPKAYHNKFWLILVALILVIAGIVAVGKNPITKDTSENQTASLNDLRVRSENLTAAHRYDEAITVWDDFLTSPKRSDEEKIHAHFGKALVYTNKGDHKSALEQYRQAEQISSKPRADIVGGILSAAIQTGDKALEREYLRKTIELLNPQDPLYEADKAAYENRLKELDAQSD